MSSNPVADLANSVVGKQELLDVLIANCDEWAEKWQRWADSMKLPLLAMVPVSIMGVVLGDLSMFEEANKFEADYRKALSEVNGGNPRTN